MLTDQLNAANSNNIGLSEQLEVLHQKLKTREHEVDRLRSANELLERCRHGRPPYLRCHLASCHLAFDVVSCRLQLPAGSCCGSGLAGPAGTG